VRAEAGMLDGVEFIGTGTLVERLWAKPSLSVLGIDAPAVRGAASALVPVARAKLSTRLAPGDDPDKALAALRDHLQRYRPWGVALSVEPDGVAAPCAIDTAVADYDAVRSALTAAWDGVAPVEVGVGGSIPAVATFKAAFPAATIMVTGVEDPHTQAHGANESLHLGEFRRVCLAEALLLANLGRDRR
jgi:acetylornithine deacetylase/succinyl-diaminopimelate desuccinylase-like protein